MSSGATLAVLFVLAQTPVGGGAFEMGLRAYEDGDHESAVVAFEAALAEQVDASTLYNYGNALARTERWPEALAAYRSAQVRAPGDADIRHNVRLARVRVGQRPASSWIPRQVTAFFERVSARSLLWVLVGLAWLWAASAIMAGVRGSGIFVRATWLGAFAVLVLAGAYSWRHFEEARPRAVVTVSTPAQSDPSAAGSSLFGVPAGTEVYITDTRDEWVQVRIQRRNVWLRAGSLQPLW